MLKVLMRRYAEVCTNLCVPLSAVVLTLTLSPLVKHPKLGGNLKWKVFN